MSPIVKDFILYVQKVMPKDSKKRAQEETQKQFNMTKDGTVFYTEHFAVRFCESKKGSLSNTVLALSKLQKFDNIPFFVVFIIKQQDCQIYLANSSLLKKISHSSHELKPNNIKGSFNGSDIIKVYNETANTPENFNQLFAIHEGFTWKENLERLVESTSQIEARSKRFTPNEKQTHNICASVDRAKEFIESEDYQTLKNDLDERVHQNLQAILIASRIENVNIRGRLIEYLVTSGNNTILDDLSYIEKQLPVFDTKNGLGDYVKKFHDRKTYTDIKTKIMYLSSNPKAYNIDKFLECMSEEDSVFMFYFIDINETGVAKCVLCSVYDKQLIDATICQFHWAGRATRGVAQFNGSILSDILNSPTIHKHEIASEKSISFLEYLLQR